MRNLFAIVAILFVCNLPSSLTAQTVDRLVAVVSEAPITQQQMERLVGPDVQFLSSQYADKPEVLHRKEIELIESGTEALITRAVILNDAKETFVSKIPSGVLDEFVNQRIKDKFPDHVALVKRLEAEGMTMEQLKKDTQDQVILEEMNNKFVPESVISPIKIQNYYVEHKNDFRVDDEIKMRMIVLNKSSGTSAEDVRKRCGEILLQIRGGASFEDLAKTYSEGSLRDQGGETGWEELSVVNTNLVTAINRLKPGEISDIVETPESFFLLLLEDRHPSHIKPLAELRVQIEAKLIGEDTERRRKEWIERLKKKTFIKQF
jgi:peptidyl-prolyl cis-trans isomerase SurA